MGVSAMDPHNIPTSCPRCHTLVRGLSGPISDLLPPPSQRQNLILIHNDNPVLTSYTIWKRLDVLVFRGARVAYEQLNQEGFAAVYDGRFPMPTIIRDKWSERGVTTRMQTKSVLAWSKSFTKALEYAYGCIQGGLSGVTPGNLYFGWVEIGVDVTEEVRDFESRFSLQPIPEGEQKEVLTPTLPKSKILASWQLIKGKGGYGSTQVIKKGRHDLSGSVSATYNKIDGLCPLDVEFNFYDVGQEIDELLRRG